MKVCAKHDDSSYASAVRPQKDASTGISSCPSGLKACLGDIERTVCVDSTQVCPITAIAWTLDGLTAGEAAKYQ